MESPLIGCDKLDQCAVKVSGQFQCGQLAEQQKFVRCILDEIENLIFPDKLNFSLIQESEDFALHIVANADGIAAKAHQQIFRHGNVRNCNREFATA